MNSLYFLQIDIAGYTYTIVSETSKGCHDAMKRQYDSISKSFPDGDRNYYQFLDYVGIEQPYKFELNKVFHP